MTDNSGGARQRILDLVRDHYVEEFREHGFVPGSTPVPVSGETFDEDDIIHLVNASLGFRLASGQCATRLEREPARLVRSGTALRATRVLRRTSSRKLGDRALEPEDEVITVAATIPTTVGPIVQNGLVPVFLDVELSTCNADVTMIEKAIGRETRTIMLGHTPGNPFDLDTVSSAALSDNSRTRPPCLSERCGWACTPGQPGRCSRLSPTWFTIS